MTNTPPPARSNGARSRNAYRWIRQLHLWIGAWGALAAVLYGLTGLVMNHRMGESAWPQGESVDTGRETLQVPVQARTSAEALSLWLREQRQLDAQTIRKGPPRGGRAEGPGGGMQWNLSGGSARASWSVQYTPGAPEAELKRSEHSWMAAFNRLHKTVGGGWAWVLLADSFAIAMVLLGLSGIWMWARGRDLKQMLVSVFAAGVLVLGVVLAGALS